MRSVAFVFGVTLFLNVVSAQEGAANWEYIPAVSRDDVKLAATHGIGSDGRYVITWIGSNAKGGPIRFDVYDRETKSHVKTVRTEWPAAGHYIERWVGWNNGTYQVTLDYDGKAERLDVKAQRYRMPDLEADGEPIALGSLPIKSFSTTFWGAGLRFEQSEDGERLLVLFDRLESDKGKLMAACWVFDQAWGPIQQSIFELKGASHMGSGTRAALVDDAGVVHLLVNASFDGPDGKKGEPGHKVIRVDRGVVSDLPVPSPAEGEVTSAGMIRMGNELLLAGFYQNKDNAGGRFQTRLSQDLSHAGDMVLDPFSEPMKQITRAQVIEGKSGSYFLVGNACTPVGLDISAHKELSVTAYDGSGARQWTKSIPRAVGLTKYDEQGFLGVGTSGGLSLLIPDDPENVAKYNAGKAPKSAQVALKTLMVRFDDAGEATYVLFGAPAYTMLYQGISLLPDGHTVFQHAAPAGSKMDRNQAYAFVDLLD